MADSDHQVLRVRVGTISVEKFKFNAEAKLAEKNLGLLGGSIHLQLGVRSFTRCHKCVSPFESKFIWKVLIDKKKKYY